MRTSFHHQSEAQPPNGPLTAATSPDTPSPAPASQSGLHRLTYEGRSKPCGTAAFRRYDSVSVCGIGPWKCQFGPLSPGAIFGVSFFTERRGGAAVLEPLMAVLPEGAFLLIW